MKPKPSRNYIITHFGGTPPTPDDHVRYLIYQKEQCPKTGMEHWQGYAEFHQTMRYATACKYLNIPGAHLEIRKGTRDQARAYCMKKETRVTPHVEFGSWIKGGQGARTDLQDLVDRVRRGDDDQTLIDNDPGQACCFQRFIKWIRNAHAERKQKEYVTKWAKTITLNPFQIEILDRLKEQNSRQVTWVCDYTGNRGKTILSKWMCAKGHAQRFTNGRSRDIAYAFDPEKSIMIFDLARTCEARINYQVIEDLKNGMLFSPKYESKSIVFAEPKILILANFMPNLGAMSDDRWDILKYD